MKKGLKILLWAAAIFVGIGIIAVIDGEDEKKEEKQTTNKEASPVFLSARKVVKDLQEEGIEFANPNYIDDSTMLLLHVSNYPSRNIWVYYNEKDTIITSANSIIRFDSNRDNLISHYENISFLFDAISKDAADWAEMVIEKHDNTKELETDTLINGHRFWISYYPNVIKDNIQAGFDNKLK